MKRLLIEPLDVLMFRSERPFIARESHVAKLGVISPLTFEGALKSKVFLENLDEKYDPSYFQRRKNKGINEFKEQIIEKVNEDENLRRVLEVIGHPAVRKSSSLRVLAVFLCRNQTECFPMPNDIGKKGENNLLKAHTILKNELKMAKTEKYACFFSYSKVEKAEGLISFNALIEYLHGKDPKKHWKVEKLYVTEERTGIMLEKGRKITVRGYLYTAEFLRLEENCGFILWYELDSDIGIPEGILRLGGEGRGAICRKIGEIDLAEKLKFSELVEQINNEGKFKLYLASPSYLGSYEPPLKKLQEILGVDTLDCVAALPGKPIYVGGYDFALNEEKPLRRWVNSGAVYYYRFEGKIRSDLGLPLKILDDGYVDMRCALIGRW